jgi:PAS domain S-box-containing protein
MSNVIHYPQIEIISFSLINPFDLSFLAESYFTQENIYLYFAGVIMIADFLPPESNPEVAQLRARNAQLEKELEQLRSQFITSCQEQTRTQVVLQRNEMFFEQVAEHLQAVLWLTGPNDTDLLYVSPAYERIWGQVRPNSMKELYEQWRESIFLEDRAQVHASLAQLPKIHYEMKYRIQHPDGSFRWIRDRGFPIYDGEGNLKQIAGIAEDITECVQLEEERQQAEQQLKQLNQELELRVREGMSELERSQANLRLREAEFRTLVEHSPDIITRSDRDFRCIYTNPAIERLGISASQILGKTIEEMEEFAEHQAAWKEALDQVFKTQKPRKVESKIRVPSGQVYLQSLMVPEFDNDGNVISTLTVTRNITDFKKTEAGLRQSEERFRRVFEDSPLGMGIVTAAGQFLMVNERLCQITGYSRAELHNLTFWDITHPEDRYKEFEILQEILQKSEKIMSLEKRYTRKDGTLIWVRLTAALIADETDELQHLGMVEDISDRKQAELDLKRSLNEKEILLKEIHHRVKNNMQTVSSLLSLQASYIENLEILAPFIESQNRIRAMALIHERLYRSDSLAKVSFPEYVRKLVADLCKSYQFSNSASIGLKFEIADVDLDVDVAMPCGLIINELVSNALKYAFPENFSGTIQIHFTKNATNNYTLSVKDNGIGFPEEINPYTSDSLGLQLVCSFVKKLRGKIEIDQHVGSNIVITFVITD